MTMATLLDVNSEVYQFWTLPRGRARAAEEININPKTPNLGRYAEQILYILSCT